MHDTTHSPSASTEKGDNYAVDNRSADVHGTVTARDEGAEKNGSQAEASSDSSDVPFKV